MSELDFEALRSELLASIRTQFDDLRSEMRAQFNSIRANLTPMRAQLDGLPLINRALTSLQQDTRGLRAAFNDFARTNVTVGEIEALHADVNRVQAESVELATRINTLERLLREKLGNDA